MTGVLRVMRDVGDEAAVDMARPEAQQAPLAWVLGAVRATWPELDPARQVLIDPATCTRVKNDARLRQLLARAPTGPAAAAEPTVFLFDVRILNPHSVVQPSAPQLFRLATPIPGAPSQRLTKGMPLLALCEEDVAAAQAVAAVCRLRNEACALCLKQLDNMRAAVRVSFATLATRVASLATIFARLRAPVADQLQTLECLTGEFPRYLDVMAKMELPAVLRAFVLDKNPQLRPVAETHGGVLRLLDLVPSEELVVYVRKSTEYAGNLSAEMARIDEQIAVLHSELEPFQARLDCIEPETLQRVDALGALLEQAAKEFDEISAAAADFSHDCALAKSRPADTALDSDETLQEHEITLSQLSQWEANSSTRHKEFIAVHGLMLEWLVNRLRMVSAQDGKVSACFKQMKGVEQSSLSLNEAVVQLQCAKRMPQAYVRYEQEMIRRTRFRAELDQELAKAQSTLREMCNSEIALRKEFQMSCVQYLPKTLQEGTYSLPPMIDAFRIDPFDQGLPAMTEDDTQHIQSDILSILEPPPSPSSAPGSS